MTFRSILVPLDGSAFAEHALPHALALARRTGAGLDLVGAVPDIPEDVMETEARAHDYLAGVVHRVRAAATGPVAPVVVRGRPADAVSEYAARARTDLIVLTTHGRGPLSRFWLGSMTTELIPRAPTAVLVVRPDERPPDLAADPAPRRILIPLDGSGFAEQVVPLATAVGGLTGAAYRLLRVVPPLQVGGWDGTDADPTTNRTVAEELAAAARAYLAAVKAHTPAVGAAETEVAVTWPPATAILADAEAHRADLIAMATRGRSGLDRMLLGSVADKVVRGSTVSVLLRRPAGG